MRLTLVISSLASGGAERVLSTMANYWAERDWPIHLLTFDDGQSAPFYALHPAVVHRPLGLAGPSEGAAEGFSRNLGRVCLLRRAITETAPEAVISFIDRTNVLTLLAGVGLRPPVLISERTDPHQCRIGRPWEVMRRLLYPRAEFLVVQSERAGRFFPAAVQRKTRVIPNPVQLAARREDLPIAHRGSERLIMSLGRLTGEKGHAKLLSAFASVAADYLEWRLEIWGEGPERSSLEAMVRDLALAGRISLPGRTSEPFEQLRRADLFVLSSRREGFPNALCEAMACGLPVISFDCPSGPADIIRDGVDGLLVPPEDVDALAAAMRRLIAGEEERRRLAQRAPEVLIRFGMEKVMGMWQELLCLATSRRSSADPRRDLRRSVNEEWRRPQPHPDSTGR
jgi:glycosyltransferase involved in cell wall biosynthesis